MRQNSFTAFAKQCRGSNINHLDHGTVTLNGVDFMNIGGAAYTVVSRDERTVSLIVSATEDMTNRTRIQDQPCKPRGAGIVDSISSASITSQLERNNLAMESLFVILDPIHFRMPTLTISISTTLLLQLARQSFRCHISSIDTEFELSVYRRPPIVSMFLKGAAIIHGQQKARRVSVCSTSETNPQYGTRFSHPEELKILSGLHVKLPPYLCFQRAISCRSNGSSNAT